MADDVRPVPPAMNFNGRMRAFGATPAMPTPLPAAAATTPATWVPCRSFAASSKTVASPAAKSQPPGATTPARSGCETSTPVSTTATTTGCRAPAAAQASGASMSASCSPPSWPVLRRAHWFGELGILRGRRLGGSQEDVRRPPCDPAERRRVERPPRLRGRGVRRQARRRSSAPAAARAVPATAGTRRRSRRWRAGRSPRARPAAGRRTPHLAHPHAKARHSNAREGTRRMTRSLSARCRGSSVTPRAWEVRHATGRPPSKRRNDANGTCVPLQRSERSKGLRNGPDWNRCPVVRNCPSSPRVHVTARTPGHRAADQPASARPLGAAQAASRPRQGQTSSATAQPKAAAMLT